MYQLKRKEACSKACADMMKTEPYCQTTIYLTGKADCKLNTLDPNAWMPPKQICCSKFLWFGLRAIECHD